MSLSETDTQTKFANPAIYRKGWTEDHITRKETTGAVDTGRDRGDAFFIYTRQMRRKGEKTKETA